MTDQESAAASSPGATERRLVVFGPVPTLSAGWTAVVPTAGDHPGAVSGPFDTVLVSAPIQSSVLLGWLYDSASPLAPLIDLSGANLARADIQAPIVTPDTVAAGLARAGALASELDMLAPVPLNQDRDGLIILGLMFSRKADLVPVLDAGQKDFYCYPRLDGISDASSWLEMLADAGLLSRTFHDRVYVCGQCQSARLSVREVCQGCKSSQITEETLVHHYRCGMQGPRSTFLHGETLVCPKCSGVLRHFGVDYDTPGQIICCHACGGTATDPEISFLCADCRTVTSGASARRRDWHSFRLTKAGEVAAIEGRLPGTRLHAMMEGLKGWRSPREMASLLDLCAGLASRYKRPYTVATLSLADPSAIIARSGRTGLARLHRLIVDLVAETVRSTDGVAILGDRVIICLPETPPDHGPFIVKRLRDRLGAAVADADTVQIAIIPAEEVGALAAELVQG